MKTLFNYIKYDEKTVAALTKEMGCHKVMACLLSARGITDARAAECFLNPDFNTLTDPFLLKDIEKAVKRIFSAIEHREKILVFGDFDADGVTSTALLVQFLEHCEAEVSWYIPHRVKEGYSLQPDHIKTAMQQDIDLIITTDCGITSFKAVEDAAAQDIDVIITDHHEPDAVLPDALAVINPKRKDCGSGLEYLAGVGVALFLVIALRKYLRDKNFWEEKKEPNLSDYLDLFAIGTIGDMVPLTQDNRTLCIAGMKKIVEGRRMGIRSIARACRLECEKLDSDDISFKIVPRINAAGRISHARICVPQLIDDDPLNAEKTACILDELNLKRQLIEKEIIDDIEKKIFKAPELLKKRILLLHDDKWNPSVLGIAASKLTQKYNLPVILLGGEGEQASGSGRSINGIDILRAVSSSQSLLERFGGHKMACGLSLNKQNIPLLYESLDEHLTTQYMEQDFTRTVSIDAVLDFSDISFDLAGQVARLKPFGIENPEPLFLSRNVSVKSSVLIAGRHRKMFLEDAASPSGTPSGSNLIEAFEFNIENCNDCPDFFSQIVYRLKINKFKKNSVQIIIENH